MRAGSKKVISALMAFVISFLYIFHTAYADEISTNLNLYAQSAVLMDADSGRVLFDKDGYKKMPMASTTKIMTCIVALENGNLSDYVEVSSYAAGMPKVKLHMREGEWYNLEDLLYSLMLESHNDSAVAIAEHIGGSTEKFAEMMNRKAKEIGCHNTTFITPNGLDAQTVDGSKVHSTTAADLALIMSYCIMGSPQKEEFIRITRTPSHAFSNYIKGEGEEYAYGNRNYSCNNKNAFLNMMDGALSGKTGFTNKAGYCYVGSLERDGRVFVVVVLACGWPNHKNYKWSDTVQLMNYGLENYSYRDVYRDVNLKEIEVVGGVPKNNKPYDRAYAEVKTDTGGEDAIMRLLRPDEEVDVKVDIPSSIEAPVEEGEKVGTVTYYLGNEVLKEYPIVIKEQVNEINFIWMMKYILQCYSL